MLKFPFFILILILFSGNLLSQPKDIDYVLGYGGLTIVAFNQLFLDTLAPTEPNWKEPNSFDLYFRNKLKWSDSNINIAEKISDILVWGTLALPSTFLAPSLGDYPYNQHLLINIQILAATGILVGATKYLIARQRPYSYFEIETGADKSRDYLSFFSGHTAFAFASATTTSMMLQDKYKHNSGLIWSGTITLATITGMLRIAADRHYMTDVLSGAVVGTLTAYLITRNQKKKYFDQEKPSMNIFFNLSFPL